MRRALGWGFAAGIAVAGASAAPQLGPVEIVVVGNDAPSVPAPCPQHITFRFKIKGAEGQVVTYRFVRSDGGKSATATVSLGLAGVVNAVNAITVGSASKMGMRSFDGWVKLEVVSPDAVTSAPSNFQMECS